jgi:hypothetical protein
MQRASLKRQLILISMCTTTAALLVACTLFLCYDYVTFRDSDLASLDTLATTVGAGTAAAVSFGDVPTAQEALDALAGHVHVQTARVYTDQGIVFAEYRRAGAAAVPASWGTSPALGQHITWQTLEAVQPIAVAGEPIGTIAIQASRQGQHARMQRFAAMAAGIILTSWIVAFLITSRL